MKRWLLFALVLLLPLASASTSLHLEWELGEQTDVEHRYVEHFPDQMMQCGECNTTNDVDVVVNWWRHSDTTGSDWPDDDANLRAGTNGIEIDETASLINGNGEDTRQHIVDLTGTLSVRSDYEEQYYFVANMTFTPQVELRDDALMQILFIETDATDQHGRELSFLVRDMTPMSASLPQQTTHLLLMLKSHMNTSLLQALTFQKKHMDGVLSLSFSEQKKMLQASLALLPCTKQRFQPLLKNSQFSTTCHRLQ